MKRTICIFISAMLMLSSCSMFGSLGKKSEDSSFIEVANLLIENGDYEGALNVLKEGAEKTGSSVIKSMIYDVSEQIKNSSESDVSDDVISADKETESESNSENVSLEEALPEVDVETIAPDEIENYAAAAIGVWTSGDAKLIVTENDFTFSDISSGSSRLSEVYDTYPISSIVNNVAVVSYTDSWNNSGTHTFVFSKDYITVTSLITQYDPYAMWQYGDSTKTLYRMPEEAVPENNDVNYTASEASPFDLVNFGGQSMINGYFLSNYEAEYLDTLMYPSNDYSTLAAAPLTIIGVDGLQTGQVVYFCEYPASSDYTIQLFGEIYPQEYLEVGTQIIPYMVYKGQSWNYMGNCFDFDMVSYTVVG